MAAPATTHAGSPHTPSLGVLAGELLCEAVDVHAGERMLDVSAGGDDVVAAGARRWADVTTIDVPQGDDGLPFPEDTFDVVLSAFGALAAPDPRWFAEELVRVCRPSGRIGITTWERGTLVDAALRVVDRWVPGAAAGLECGREACLREMFGNRIRSLRVARCPITFRYRSPDHMLEHFRICDPATRNAFAHLDAANRGALGEALVAVYAHHNRADDGTLVAASHYVQAVAVVR